jgi:enamine deaminase RidA (YjgF/YER057c/UK114 family)
MIARTKPTPTSNRVVIHNGVLYLGGLGAPDRGQDMYGQAQQVLARIDGFLDAAGTGKENILRATIFITDYALKDGMNRAWKEWMPKEHAPARATIAVGDMGDDLLVEIEITAAIVQ